MTRPLGMYALRLLGDVAESEDVVADTFAAVWVRVAAEREPDDMRSYLYRAVRNRCLSVIRARHPAESCDDRGDDLAEDSEVSETAMLAAERDAAVWAAVDRLPERTRRVFLLAKRDGLSHAEIADEMGISVKTVENQMTRALKALRPALAPYAGRRVLPSVLFLPLL